MLKKILGFVFGGIIFANFGILSAAFPIFYVPLNAMFGTNNVSNAPTIISALLCGIIASLTYYIYQRKLRLDHEPVPSYLTIAFVGYIIGIALVIGGIFVMSGNPNYGIIQ